MADQVLQNAKAPEVSKGMPPKMSHGLGPGLEARRGRMKVHAKQSMAMAILGEGKNPGLLLRTLAAMGKAVDRDPEGMDVAMHLDIADRCIRALPWILEKEGEDVAGLAKALAGHSGAVQIVFGQHFHARSNLDQGQAGQALPGQAEAGSKLAQQAPDQPAPA